MDIDTYVKKLLWQGTIICILFIASGVYLLFFIKEEPPPAVPPPSTFWSGKTFLSEQGYIVTENFLPLRALARKPNVRLYKNQKDRLAMDVVGVMEPWLPYYIYSFAPNEGRMQIGTGDSETRLWVSYDECFCWPTRECLTIEDAIPVYNSVEAAKAHNVLEPAYLYRYQDHFSNDKAANDLNRSFATMAALPVISRQESVFWCILRPEGDANGYQQCWIQSTEDSPSITFRIRTTREEWAKYLTDLYKLQSQYRDQSRSEETKQDMVNLYVSFMAFDSRERAGSIGRTSTQAKGILRLTGGIQSLLQNDMEYQQIRDKFVKLTEFDSTTNNWNSDVAFPPVDILF